MKLVKRVIEKDGSGFLKLTPECGEDLWHIYNLLAQGDKVTATTARKVQRETGTGGQESEKMTLKLTIAIEGIEYDATAEEIRVRGKIVEENEHVKLGSYHTIELASHRALQLYKEAWDVLDLDRIKLACDPAASADLAAVMIQEGLAHICLVGNNMTVMRAKVEKSMPRKRGAAAAGFDKALSSFLEQVLQGVLRHVDFSVVRCLIVAGPGFTKDQFHKYMLEEAVKRDLKAIMENKSRLLLAHASSGFKHALKEVLASPEVLSQIKDTKAVSEVHALDEFFTMLSNDSTRAFYGPGHVMAAHEVGAVATLLITDALFRNQDPTMRRKWVKLVEDVREAGGVVHVFSAAHVSGEQLGQLTGVAAVLRFPMPELEDAEL